MLVELFLAASAEKVKLSEMSRVMIEMELRKHGIIPDVVGDMESPNNLIKITYTIPNKNETRFVRFGNDLQPTDLSNCPTNIEWPGYLEDDYTLMMVDPDSPSRLNSSQREKIHWLIVNNPGQVLRKKDTLFDYIGPQPSQGTGYHRYVFLVYGQPRADMTFDEPRLHNDLEDVRRNNFSCREFAKKYNFSKPVAVNFFYARTL
nr:PREDICTED: protein D3-like isoform X1 [Bemisia tabaci]XP_018901360.1 PREDICTED: protein D3-like isoform X1 [Bemisia tabaci]XP_018901361.1 PREDICTED: protein D3-like isoform X1 [Bemisia tabaci]